jgi:hypothetical protein
MTEYRAPQSATQFHSSKLGVAPALIIDTARLLESDLGVALNRTVNESSNTIICVTEGTPDLTFIERAIQAVSGSGSAQIIFKRYGKRAIILERAAWQTLGGFAELKSFTAIYDALLQTVTDLRVVGAIEIQRPFGATKEEQRNSSQFENAAPLGEPQLAEKQMVAVLRLNPDSLRLGEESLIEWLATQPARSIEHHTCTIHPCPDPKQMLETLLTALAAVGSQYILIHYGNVVYDRAIIPVLTQALQATETAQAALFTIRDEDNAISPTALKNCSYQALCQHDARFSDPFYLMAHCIFRSAALKGLIAQCASYTTKQQFAARTWEFIQSAECLDTQISLAEDRHLDAAHYLTHSFTVLTTPFIFSPVTEKTKLESAESVIHTVHTLTEVAVSHLQADSNIHALAILRRILKLAPDQTLLYYARAIAAARLHLFNEAEASLTELLNREPTHALGRELLAYCQSVLPHGTDGPRVS